MHRPLRPALAALSALALVALGGPGCLDAGRGQVGGDTLGGDTTVADTTGADTTVDPCAGQTCDDGDPCTWDQCDPATGTCEHLALPHTGVARPECMGDTECDDGDPCTLDTCVVHDDGCGFVWSSCEHEAADGCFGCQVHGCPSDDPCTVGTCHDDGSCTYAAVPDCTGHCNSVGALNVTEAGYQLVGGDFGKVAGRVAPDPYAYCLDRTCACSGLPTLGGDGVTPFYLYTPDPGAGDDSAWSCSYDYCSDAVPSCGPVLYDAAYWVWGTATYGIYAAPQRAGAGPPLPPVDGMQVIDYCLQTNLEGLPGSYVVTLTGATFAAVLTLEGRITADTSGQLWLHLNERDCPECGLGVSPVSHLFPQDVAIEAGDGWIAFDIDMPTNCSAIRPPARATLISRRNTLSGEYFDPSAAAAPHTPSGEPIYCSFGALSLTRLPVAEAP